MREDMQVRYHGPAYLRIGRDTPQPFRLSLYCPTGLPTGTEVCTTVGNYRSVIEPEWTLTGVEVTGQSGNASIVHDVPGDFEEAEPWEEFTIERHRIRLCTIKVDNAISAGSVINFRFDGTAAYHTHLDTTFGVRVREPDGNGLERVGQPVVLAHRAGPPANVEVRISPAPNESGCTRGTILATDSYLNPTPLTGTVSLSATRPIEGLPESVEMERKHRGTYVLNSIDITVDEPVRITAELDRYGFEATSNVAVPNRLAGWHHYFGAIHFHTRFSYDGDGDVRDAFRYARDALNLDFVSVTDHYPQSDWNESVAALQSFHDPGTFVTIPAWEWNTDRGHANLYLRSLSVDAGPDHYEPERYPYQESWPDDVVMVPHHTNVRSALNDDGEHYWTEYNWAVPNDRIRLVEVVQTRGSFETDDPNDDWGVLTGGAGASVRDALAMGYRIGFVGGTDNHSATPTRDPQRPGEYVGLTGVAANERTRASLWDALNDRRTYATSGVPIVCHFEVNDAIMGQERTISPDENVSFSARLFGTTTIERVEIISNGEPVWSRTPDESTLTLTDELLPAPDGDTAYYYLRLKQSDGHMAWASPVWLDYVR